jgi:hypothetical protein
MGAVAAARHPYALLVTLLQETRAYVMTIAVSPTYETAIVDLRRALSLDFIEPEIRKTALRLFEEKFVKLVQIRFKSRAAFSAGEQMVILEPSNLLLGLIAALVANDRDRVLAIDHDARS